MNSPTVATLADAYGISKRRVLQLRQRHRLDKRDLLDPDKLLQVLLESGNACPLRERLTNPATRARIAEQIDLAAIRGNVPPIEAKLQAIK